MKLEELLKTVKDAELDIELLRRKNEKECADRNSEIEALQVTIDLTIKSLQSGLKESGEDKLECKLGSVSWQKMPDSWDRNNADLMTWVKSLPKTLAKQFLKIAINLNWSNLKKRIISDNETYFENGKITDEGLKSNLNLKDRLDLEIGKAYDVKGIKIVRQDPKFKYTLKKVK